jgi:hypothetical protein
MKEVSNKIPWEQRVEVWLVPFVLSLPSKNLGPSLPHSIRFGDIPLSESSEGDLPSFNADLIST